MNFEEAKSHAQICSGLAEQYKQDPLLFAALTDAAAIIKDLVEMASSSWQPPEELPAEKVRQIVRDAGCDWPEDDSLSSRMWRLEVKRIVNAAWRRGCADCAGAQRLAALDAALKADEALLRQALEVLLEDRNVLYESHSVPGQIGVPVDDEAVPALLRYESIIASIQKRLGGSE
jgi:hypothetical protein